MAGTAEAVGPGVTNFKAGDTVFAVADIRVNGTYTEYLALPAAIVCPKPKTIDFTAAEAIPLAGITAWEALFEQADLIIGQADLIIGQADLNGQTILIHSAGEAGTGAGKKRPYTRQNRAASVRIL